MIKTVTRRQRQSLKQLARSWRKALNWINWWHMSSFFWSMTEATWPGEQIPGSRIELVSLWWEPVLAPAPPKARLAHEFIKELDFQTGECSWSSRICKRPKACKSSNCWLGNLKLQTDHGQVKSMQIEEMDVFNYTYLRRVNAQLSTSIIIVTASHPGASGACATMLF